MRFHREGFLIMGVATGIILFLVTITFLFIPSNLFFLRFGISILLCFLLLLIIQFFRVPNRVIAGANNDVVCPADGKVVVIEEVLDKSNPFNKIIVVRSAVQSREIGHLPGDVGEKMDIYEQPYRQICQQLFDRKDAWDRLEEQGHVQFISTSFIRGMSFDDAIIIVDEMQNMTFEEIDTVMTRVGYRSKIIWCGDYRQTDLNKKKNDVTGILKFFDVAHHMKAFTRIEFTVDDIVRSSLVKDYILAKLKYEDFEDKK